MLTFFSALHYLHILCKQTLKTDLCFFYNKKTQCRILNAGFSQYVVVYCDKDMSFVCEKAAGNKTKTTGNKMEEGRKNQHYCVYDKTTLVK